MIIKIIAFALSYVIYASSGFSLRRNNLSRQGLVIRDSINMKSDSLVSALDSGQFVKFICGASNQDVPFIRNLCMLYTLAKVDCIDISSDMAVVNAAVDGIHAAKQYLLNTKNITNFASIQEHKPYVMISVNDDEDPHFRKAKFDPRICPTSCTRPCERVCPAWAIPPIVSTSKLHEHHNPSVGVIDEKCYGCGRCVPSCPFGLIETEPYTVDRARIRQMLSSGLVQAIEIHTQPGHDGYFRSLWSDIGTEVLTNVKLIAVSFPDMGSNTLPYLQSLQGIFESHPLWNSYTGVQIWQADGRPMSGDIGKGTAHAAVALAKTILHQGTISSSPSNDHVFQIGRGVCKQYLQLAGGTNQYSAMVAAEANLTKSVGFGGYAFGGYARRKIGQLLQEISNNDSNNNMRSVNIEDNHELFVRSLDLATSLVRTVKS